MDVKIASACRHGATRARRERCVMDSEIPLSSSFSPVIVPFNFFRLVQHAKMLPGRKKSMLRPADERNSITERSNRRERESAIDGHTVRKGSYRATIPQQVWLKCLYDQ